MFARIALRLAAMEALNPAATAASGPWPTLAGQNVYEERIDPIAAAESAEDLRDALGSLENKPVVTIYTEDHHSTPYGSVKYPPDENVCTLAVEIALGATGIVPIFDGTGAVVEFGTIDAPVTDRQQAAILDVLEDQIRWLFDGRNLAPSAALLRGVLAEIRSIHSDPQRAADRSARLALRTIKFHCKIRGTQWDEPGATPGAGLAALPEPLRSVAQGLPAGSSGAALCASLVKMVPSATGIGAPLAGVTFVLGVGRTPTIDTADVIASAPPAPSGQALPQA